jgi:hypothetical protein
MLCASLYNLTYLELKNPFTVPRAPIFEYFCISTHCDSIESVIVFHFGFTETCWPAKTAWLLKVNENYSSQMPSCLTGRDNGHPSLPNEIPPVPDRLQQQLVIWAVKHCPHCLNTWQRDVTACRYVFYF